jgi:hypothetical protein
MLIIHLAQVDGFINDDQVNNPNLVKENVSVQRKILSNS